MSSLPSTSRRARQIADCFHLLVNLQTAMVRLFERKHETLKRIAEQEHAVNTSAVATPTQSSDEVKSESKPQTPTQVQQQARRARRKNRYEEVIELHKQGLSQTAMATLVGLDRDTVRSYIRPLHFLKLSDPVGTKASSTLTKTP